MCRVEGLLTSVCLLSLAAMGCGPVGKPAPPVPTASEDAAGKLVGVWQMERPAAKSKEEQAILDIVDLRLEMEFTPDQQVTYRSSRRDLKTGETERSENKATWKLMKASGNELILELPSEAGSEQYQVKLLDDDHLEMKSLSASDTQPQRWNRVPAAADKP
jgi:hypothetical protein